MNPVAEWWGYMGVSKNKGYPTKGLFIHVYNGKAY
jgi:hypothetical protein